MTPESQLQPAIDPELLNAGYAPPLMKTVRGGEKLKGVQPELLDHWNNLQGEFDKAGIRPEIKSGFRTTQAQQNLYNNPATRARTKGNDGIVNISPHQEGRALDISFNSAQKAKGRQIIADYARRNGLHVPSDEPWHIALGRPQSRAIDPDLLNAGYGETDQQPQSQIDPDLLNAGYEANPSASPKVRSVAPSVTDALNSLNDFVSKQTAKVQPQGASTIDYGNAEPVVPHGAGFESSRKAAIRRGIQNQRNVLQSVGLPDTQNPVTLIKRLVTGSTPEQEIEQETNAQFQSEQQANTERQRLLAQMTPSDLAEIKDFTDHLQGKGGVYSGVRAGIRQGGSGGLYKLAGLADIANTIQKPLTGRDSWIPDYLKRKALAGELSVEDIPVEKRNQLAEFLAQSAVGLAEVAAAPGGAVTKFAGLAGTEALGRGKSKREVLKETAKGATIGGVFKGGEALAPEGAGLARRIATTAPAIGAGTLATETAFGTPPREAAISAASNAAFGGFGELAGGRNARPTETQRQGLSQTKPTETVPSTVASPDILPRDEANVASLSSVRDDLPTANASTNSESRQRFRSLQFGDVEVTDSQEGARAGRLRVAEVNDPTKIHYVKKADRQGRGNAQLLPIKEPSLASVPASESQSPAIIPVEPAGEGVVAPEVIPSRLENVETSGQVSLRHTPLEQMGELYHNKIAQSVRAYDPDGKEIGRLIFTKAGYPLEAFVEPEYRRQGIATKMYDEAERRLGHKLQPGSTNEAGAAFEQSRHPAIEPPAVESSVGEGEISKLQDAVETAHAKYLKLRAEEDNVKQRGGNRREKNEANGRTFNAALDYKSAKKALAQAQYGDSYKLTYLSQGEKVSEMVKGDLGAADKRARELIRNGTADGNVNGWEGPSSDEDGAHAFVMEPGAVRAQDAELKNVTPVQDRVKFNERKISQSVIDTTARTSPSSQVKEELPTVEHKTPKGPLPVEVIDTPINGYGHKHKDAEDIKRSKFLPQILGQIPANAKMNVGESAIPGNPMVFDTPTERFTIRQGYKGDTESGESFAGGSYYGRGGSEIGIIVTKNALPPKSSPQGEVVKPNQSTEEKINEISNVNNAPNRAEETQVTRGNNTPQAILEGRTRGDKTRDDLVSEKQSPATSSAELNAAQPRSTDALPEKNSVNQSQELSSVSVESRETDALLSQEDAPLTLSNTFADPDAPHHKAVQSIRELGEPNPLNNQERVLGGVKFSVKPFDGAVYLDIESTSGVRGKGNASRVLDQILQVAKDEGADVIGVPKAFGKGGLSTEQLKQWYARHGFEPYRGDMIIKRARPSTSEVSNNPNLGTSARPEVKSEVAPTREILTSTPESKTPESAVDDVSPGAGQSQTVHESQDRSITSIKNAAVDAAREARGLPGLTAADHQSWAEAGERAREQGLDTPDKADAIAEQVLSGVKKVLSPEEEAGLRDRIRGLENDYEALAQKIVGVSDPEKIAELKTLGDALRKKFHRLTDATKEAGKWIGRALAIRRSYVDQDMLLTQLGAERAYKLSTGKEPTVEVRKQIEELVARNKELTKQVADLNERVENDQVSRATEKVRRDVAREGRQSSRKVQKKTLDDEAADLKNQFAQVWKKVRNQEGVSPSILSRFDPEGELMKIVAKLIRNRVKANIRIKAETLVDEVHGFLKDVADLNRRDVREMMSGFGRTPKPRSELQVKLDALKSELHRGLVNEDIVAGRRESPELKRAKTTAQNRVNELKQWIADGKRTVRGKSELIDDAELRAIHAERDTLQKVVDALNKPTSDPQDVAIERAIKAVEKSIADNEMRLAPGGDLQPKHQTVSPWSEELGQRQKQAEDLRNQVEAARKAAEPKVDPEDARIETALQVKQKAIDAEKEILRTGEKPNKGTKSVPWSSELGKLNRELSDLQNQRAAREKAAARPARDAARERAALESKLKIAEKAIAETQAKIDRHDTSTKSRVLQPTTPAIDAARAQNKLLNDILQNMRTSERRATREAQVASGEMTERKQGPPNMPKVNARRNAELEKQITEIGRKISEQDFSEKAKRPATVYDAEGNRLRAKLEQTRRTFNRLKEKNRESTVADALVRWKRFATLTYGTTIGKLGSAATGRMGMSPIYEGIGQIGRQIMPKTFAEEPSAKGFLKGEVAAVKQLWAGDSLRDFLSHMKGGEDLIELLYGNAGGDEFTRGSSGTTYIPRTVGQVLDRPGHYHAAIKTIPKRAAFFRYFERALDAEVNKPEPRDIRNPEVQLAIAGEAKAYEEAKRAILQQPNWVSNLFNTVVNTAARSDYKAARAFGKALQFRYPITKVPVNFVGEALTHIFGAPAGVGEVAARGIASRIRPLLHTEAETRMGEVRRNLEKKLPQAVGELEPEQRQRIARAIKVGGVGLGFVAWGMMRPDQFGGYYQPGKRDPNDVKFGGMRFMGINIPRWAGHIPPLEAAQFGATLRRVYDSMREKKGDDESAVGATKAAAKGLAEEIPFNNDSLVDVMLGPDAKGRKLLGGELRSMIPGAVQQVAKAQDYPSGTNLTERLNPFGSKEPIGRKPATIADEVRMGLPFARQRVPENEEAKAEDVKAAYMKRMRKGDVPPDSDLRSEGYSLKEIAQMKTDAKLNPQQVAFNNAPADKSLERYERMSEFQRFQVKKMMEHKAFALKERADYLLTNAKAEDKAKRQAELDTLKKRLGDLGITPRDPKDDEENDSSPFKMGSQSFKIPAMR